MSPQKETAKVRLRIPSKQLNGGIMSRKDTNYSADFKAKVVLELLGSGQTLNEVASKYKLLPKNLQNWKRQFVKNMSLAFDKTSVVNEYKSEI